MTIPSRAKTALIATVLVSSVGGAAAAAVARLAHVQPQRKTHEPSFAADKNVEALSALDANAERTVHPKRTVRPQTRSCEEPALPVTSVPAFYVYPTESSYRLVEERHTVPPTRRPAEAALRELFQGTPTTAGAEAFELRAGEVLSVCVTRGVATVDWTAEVLTQGYGTYGETMFFDAVTCTLTEFDDVDRVQFTIEGAPQREWWHFELSSRPWDRTGHHCDGRPAA